MKKFVLIAILAIFCATPAFAGDSIVERDWTHHAGLFQVSGDTGNKLYDASYSFTALTAFDRFQFGGLGLGADVYSSGTGLSNTDVSFFLVIPIVQIELTNPNRAGVHVSLGANYIYDWRMNDNKTLFGFSVSP